MSIFNLVSKFEPSGDQPRAIMELTKMLQSGNRRQTLLGVTGSGKTFTMAQIIKNLGRPTLVISHNKTLAAQLYQEFKNFFPDNAVHYFVSYYDYYQPEAYIPHSDTYIEKDSRINEFIDTMRHASTMSALTRKDCIIVASVSCIYGVGDPEEYRKACFELARGTELSQKKVLKRLAELRYERNEYDQRPGTIAVKGEIVELVPPTGEAIIRIVWNGNRVEEITTGEERTRVESYTIFPAKHFVTPQEKLEQALKNIELELSETVALFKKGGKILEAERIKQRTLFDLKMIRETGYSHGIENYSRQLSFRSAGEPPATLLDYLPKDFVTLIDESHMALPQIRGMYAGDRARKQTLVNFGFRLPSAIDNRPLKFEEFEKKVGQILYVSATPGIYELEISGKEHIAEQLIRPTGLLDPVIEVRNTRDQMKNVLAEIEKRIAKNERTIVTTLTKRMAEDLADFLKEQGVKAEYLHSDIKTLERPKILNDLRQGNYDVIVGINLLREGLDLPEVSLVVILDADKEGFLRNAQTLIQTIGRAARHTQGTVLMYADKTTASMKQAIEETERRRKTQDAYNKKHGITPRQIERPISEDVFGEKPAKSTINLDTLKKNISTEKLKEELNREMRAAAKELDFEKAAELRDAIKKLK